MHTLPYWYRWMYSFIGSRHNKLVQTLLQIFTDSPHGVVINTIDDYTFSLATRLQKSLNTVVNKMILLYTDRHVVEQIYSYRNLNCLGGYVMIRATQSGVHCVSGLHKGNHISCSIQIHTATMLINRIKNKLKQTGQQSSPRFNASVFVGVEAKGFSYTSRVV